MNKKIFIPKYPPAWFVKWFEYLRFFLTQLARKLTVPNMVIIEMLQGFYVSKAIGIAAELNLAEHLKNGDKNIAELAIITQTHEDSLYRLMRMLSCQGIFTEKRHRVFSQNRLSKALLNKQESMRYMAFHMVNGVNWNLFNELKSVVETGENAATKVLNSDVFSYLEANPEKNEIYNKAMSNSSVLLSQAVVSEYNFKNVKRIIDIGGGHGVLLSIILHKNKHLQGTLFDLSHVVEGANENFDKYGVSNRAESVSGNFFEFIPQGGDVYLMKSIIHFLDDDRSIALLKKIKIVLPEKGKILLVEAIVENNNRYSFAKLLDVQMMVGTEGGKERTYQEYKLIVEKAGLRIKRVVKTVAPVSIIELVNIS